MNDNRLLHQTGCNATTVLSSLYKQLCDSTVEYWNDVTKNCHQEDGILYIYDLISQLFLNINVLTETQRLLMSINNINSDWAQSYKVKLFKKFTPA